MLTEHAPYKRITTDSPTAGDLEWLAMLAETLEPLEFDAIVDQTGSVTKARDLCGICALLERYEPGIVPG